MQRRPSGAEALLLKAGRKELVAGHYQNVDDYIASQPAEVQPVLQEIRARIHAALPGAGEMISYGIPTITIGGHYVVYFAAWNTTSRSTPSLLVTMTCWRGSRRTGQEKGP